MDFQLPSDDKALAEFVTIFTQINNAGIKRIGDFAATQSPAFRARVIERLSSIIGQIADHDASN
jgi:hypothetical protein